MCLTSSGLAMFDPVFNSSVFIPSVISGKYLHSRHIVWVIKDFILFVKESNGFFGSLVFVNSSFNLLQEGSFFLDIMMFFDYVSMSCWESLDVVEILFVSLFVDPGIFNCNLFRFKSLLLFGSQQGLLLGSLMNQCLILLTNPRSCSKLLLRRNKRLVLMY